MTEPEVYALNQAIADAYAYARGVKAGEAKGGYRDGFDAGQASSSKSIAELQAQVAALKATVDQCRAAGFINDAGNVRKVLEHAEYVDGITWGLKPGESMLILESAAAARKARSE